MDRKNLYPVFSKAPVEYSKRYVDDLARSLNQLVYLLRNPGEGRNTTMVFTDLPTSGYGLEPGSLYHINGVVKVVLEYEAYSIGLQALGSVGTVSVTTV